MHAYSRFYILSLVVLYADDPVLEAVQIPINFGFLGKEQNLSAFSIRSKYTKNRILILYCHHETVKIYSELGQTLTSVHVLCLYVT
jgi:hypothetical protein